MSIGNEAGFPEGGSSPELLGRRTHRTFRTVFALILREISTRFGRTPGGFLWAILQPLATIVILGFAFSLISRTPALGTSFILFKATGILPFQMFRSVSTMVGKALSFAGAFLSYPGVTWMDALLARLVLNIFVSVIVSVLIITGDVIVEDISLILDWPRIFEAYALAALLGAGIGVLNCYLFERIDIWSNVWGILTAPLMIVSGVIFLYDDMPAVAQQFLWYNPVIHITGMMREGIYSTYQPGYISVPYVLACSLIPMVLGLLLVRKHHLYLINR